MTKQQNRSRPVSFRVPIERWSRMAARADAAGVSVGAWAERCVLEALDANPSTPLTGMFGAEAAMPPERDQTPGEAAYQAEREAQAERQARLDGLRGILPEAFTQ